jgi:hypothetical protein
MVVPRGGDGQMFGANHQTPRAGQATKKRDKHQYKVDRTV